MPPARVPRLPPGALRFGDLDQRPELASAALAALAAGAPGKDHLVCGHPPRMGLTPTVEDLAGCSAVLVAASATTLAGVLAICPYSREQATLWGPATADGPASPSARALVAQARAALGAARFTSVRTLVDNRNRALRAALLAQGFTAWKENLVFERRLAPGEGDPGVRAVRKGDLAETAKILAAAFPDSDHPVPGLAARAREGYRHYVLEIDDRLTGAAAVCGPPGRAWLTLIAIAPDRRGRSLGRRLLAGVCDLEARQGALAIGLEVLADNQPAVHLYASAGFRRLFAASILTAPV